LLKSSESAKGALVGPLFFLALAFAFVGSRHGAVTLWALSAFMLLAAGWAGRANVAVTSRLPIAVISFTGLILFNAMALSPAYTPAGLYQPLLLLAAFFVVRHFTHRAERDAAIAAAFSCAVLAVWGLYEVGLGGIARAQSLFETPATFSAAINLALVPMLALLLVGIRSRIMVAGAVLLSAAVFAADSRGGLLAIAAGLGLAAILAARVRLLHPRAIAILLATLAAGWVLAVAVRALPVPSTESGPDAADRAASSSSRLELFALSWEAWKERPLLGTGYLTYRYALEKNRAQVPSYGASGETWFVHNDYLQLLQELGPIGLLAFLGITLYPPLLAYRRLPQLAVDDRPAAVGIAGAMAAMSMHALVDFPFYVPFCLLLYGALLGALDRRLGVISQSPSMTKGSPPIFRIGRAGVLTLAAIVLLRPVAAEAAAEWGLRKAVAGEQQKAAFWLGAAQRMEARDWRYHWYAGQFWIAQAAQGGNREAARLAADAFAAGFDANSLEVKNLLGKVSVHRYYRHLLDEPADAATIQRWITQAADLAPMNADVQRELAR